MRDATPAVILTTSAVADRVTEYAEPRAGEPAPTVIEVDLLELDSQKAPAAGGKSLTNTAYLQYTSGSTRQPAGVMVSQENIQANFKQINADIFADYGGVAPPDTTVMSWLPFYHDMGLYLGIIFPVLTGFRTVFTSPASFLRRPARWMQMLAKQQSRIFGSPELCVRFDGAQDIR